MEGVFLHWAIAWVQQRPQGHLSGFRIDPRGFLHFSKRHMFFSMDEGFAKMEGKAIKNCGHTIHSLVPP